VLIIKDGNDVTYLSSNGKPVYNLEEATPEVLAIPLQFTVIDAEFFDQDWNGSTSISQSSKTRKTSKSWRLLCWDMLNKSEWEGTGSRHFSERDAQVDNLIVRPNFGRLVKVPNYGIIQSVSHFNELCDQAIKEGFEGLMLKKPDYVWEHKRGTDWIKFKPTETSDVRVIGFNKGKPGTKYENCLGAFVCQRADGTTFNCGGGISDPDRIDFWNRQGELMNTIIEVKEDRVPDRLKHKMKIRFPRFIRLRPDKN